MKKKKDRNGDLKAKCFRWVDGVHTNEDGTKYYYAKYKRHFWSRWRYVFDFETA